MDITFGIYIEPEQVGNVVAGLVLAATSSIIVALIKLKGKS